MKEFNDLMVLKWINMMEDEPWTAVVLRKLSLKVNLSVFHTSMF